MGRVSIELMPQDMMIEPGAITLASGSDAMDIIHLNDTDPRRVAANDWLEPRDDLMERLRDEFDQADYPPASTDAMIGGSHIHPMPVLETEELGRQDRWHGAARGNGRSG